MIRGYQLTGCREGFSSTTQSIDGVCTNKTNGGTDVYLTPVEMAAGLYTFNCFLGGTTNRFAPSHAIIGELAFCTWNYGVAIRP